MRALISLRTFSWKARASAPVGGVPPWRAWMHCSINGDGQSSSSRRPAPTFESQTPQRNLTRERTSTQHGILAAGTWAITGRHGLREPPGERVNQQSAHLSRRQIGEHVGSRWPDERVPALMQDAAVQRVPEPSVGGRAVVAAVRHAERHAEPVFNSTSNPGARACRTGQRCGGTRPVRVPARDTGAPHDAARTPVDASAQESRDLHRSGRHQRHCGQPGRHPWRPSRP